MGASSSPSQRRKGKCKAFLGHSRVFSAALVTSLIDKHNLKIMEACIAFVFQDEATEMDGRVDLGKTSKVPKKMEEYLDYDFLVTLFEDKSIEIYIRIYRHCMQPVMPDSVNINLTSVKGKVYTLTVRQFELLSKNINNFKDDLLDKVLNFKAKNEEILISRLSMRIQDRLPTCCNLMELIETAEASNEP